MLAENFFKFLYLLQYIVVIVIAFKLLMDNRPPEVLFAWTLVLLMLPWLGIILYLYAGINWQKRRIMKQLPEEAIYEKEVDLISRQEAMLSANSNEQVNDALKAMRVLLNTNHSPVTDFNNIEFYFIGKSFFESLFAEVERAKKTICMEFYIWRSDSFGTDLFYLLCAKAREGVQVALLFDGIGSFNSISRGIRRSLGEAGVLFKYFGDPTVKLNNLVVNYRNHRKVVVIDDSVAFVGGFNIGKEYLDGGSRFKCWRDTGAMITGESVRFLKDIFLAAWKHSDGSELQVDFPVVNLKVRTLMQVVCSGPDSKWHAIEKLFITLIGNANHHVYIQSPYLILDRSMQNVLEVAALSGVQVHLMIAGIPDKKLPYWIAETYFEPLLQAGVKIYRYQGGFLHSKMVIVDDSIATMGSCNFDIRGFRISYEMNVVVYDPVKVEALSNQFLKDVTDSRVIDKVNIGRYTFFRRVRDSFARIFAPLA